MTYVSRTIVARIVGRCHVARSNRYVMFADFRNWSDNWAGNLAIIFGAIVIICRILSLCLRLWGG